MTTFDLLHSIVYIALTWALWYALRSWLVKSPLDDIPGPKRQSFAKGDYARLYHRHGLDFHFHIWKKYGRVAKIHAPFGAQALYVYDPKALHHLLIGDPTAVEQSHFIVESYRLILGPGLMSITGDRHHRQRKVLNPVFSTANLQAMMPIVGHVAQELRDVIANQVGKSAQEIDMLRWMNRGALEILGQAGLGYSFGPLSADAPDQFARALKGLFPSMSRLGFLRQLTPLFIKCGSARFRRAVVERIPSSAVKNLLSIIDVMDEASRNIFLSRKRAIMGETSDSPGQVGEGKDLMSFLLRANMATDMEDRLTDDELLGQISSFVLAGTDTTASVVTQILQHLAEHTAIQDRLRQELNDVDVEHISFTALMKLSYMDAVVKETLRLNTPAAMVSRQTQKDVVIPLASPLRTLDGSLRNEIVAPKGTIIFLGLLALHRDKDIWGEDANEWKPDRWLRPLLTTVADAHIPGVYSPLMTFVGGNRSCIGFRFAEMEIKQLLAVLISSFRFAATQKNIVWNIATVRFPTIGPEGSVPQLPLIVSRV